MKTLLMSTVAALFVAGTAYAQEDVVVLIDEDADGTITVEEWDAHRADMDVFGAWDADEDSYLTQDEYMAGVEMHDDADNFSTWDETYAGWDTDGDGMLSVDEYNAGVWSAYDADADDAWGPEESAAFGTNESRFDATRMGAEISQ